MIARYILVWLWGALLSSGWWATVWWGGVPVGPYNVPVVGILTGFGTVFTTLVIIRLLITAAKDD